MTVYLIYTKMSKNYFFKCAPHSLPSSNSTEAKVSSSWDACLYVTKRKIIESTPTRPKYIKKYMINLPASLNAKKLPVGPWFTQWIWNAGQILPRLAIAAWNAVEKLFAIELPSIKYNTGFNIIKRIVPQSKKNTMYKTILSKIVATWWSL